MAKGRKLIAYRRMRFTKMHGAGNDYVYVDLFDEHVADAPALARAVSDRRTGIGADGLVLLAPSQSADVAMVMYNADGSPTSASRTSVSSRFIPGETSQSRSS